MAADRTVVLVGKTGNGKSATGNSILGGDPKPFKSKPSANGVTSVTGKAEARLSDGRNMTVIDTPGLFDQTHDTDFVGEEIVKCLEMAPEGIHAILIVLSIRNRFSTEESNAVKFILEFFGSKVSEYMIVVLTGGDELEEDNVKIQEYLGEECPEPLKEILDMCHDRYVVFKNRTRDPLEITNQRNRLLALIEDVLRKNGGEPYTHNLLNEDKDEVKFLQNDAIRSNDESKWEKQNLEDLAARRSSIIEKVLRMFKETVRILKDLIVVENNCAIM